jgi:hypothetical protein
MPSLLLSRLTTSLWGSLSCGLSLPGSLSLPGWDVKSLSLLPPLSLPLNCCRSGGGLLSRNCCCCCPCGLSLLPCCSLRL